MSIKNFFSRLMTPSRVKKMAILHFLSLAHKDNSGGEMYVLDMVNRAPHLLGLSSIYRFLRDMEKERLINSRLEKLWEADEEKPRRKYKITVHGMKELQQLSLPA